MNLETQKDFDDFYVALSPLVRSIKQKLVRWNEDIVAINKLPLPERLLAWSEWDRLCRPPLTGKTVRPHADA